ncbi:PTS sugar transporter subunit IIB [Anaerobium acetethylicum]|uniref:PTS system, ascorbate-specific IIB component n=1 Tax=Anaerobium acetethylicum TaxID=1619234 RepID=A0A1D3TS14_9FIRM|nr:PTS sugar transporter subunit IIB [Anaerobium acetethylicum]SCP96539.1 PTS system, ascorbate-specific IIB component [Anaerobium acetethylicum]
MLNILVACANGAGTSLMMKLTLEKVVKALGIKVGKIHHCSLSEGKSAATQYDVVFCPLNFITMFKDAEAKGVHVIGLKNVLSQAEMEEKLKASGLV